MEELETKRTVAKLEIYCRKDTPQPPCWDWQEGLFYCPNCSHQLEDPKPDPNNNHRIVYFDCYDCGQKINWNIDR